MPGDRPGDAPLWGVLTIIAAAFLWATGSYYSKRMTLPPDALVSTSLQMMFGGAAMLIVALPAGEYADLDLGRFSGDSWLALAYLTVVGGMLAYTAYTWLLQNAPISTVATYAYVNPVIAVVPRLGDPRRGGHGGRGGRRRPDRALGGDRRAPRVGRAPPRARAAAGARARPALAPRAATRASSGRRSWRRA